MVISRGYRNSSLHNFFDVLSCALISCPQLHLKASDCSTTANTRRQTKKQKETLLSANICSLEWMDVRCDYCSTMAQNVAVTKFNVEHQQNYKNGTG